MAVAVVLCQHRAQSCAGCCGCYNYRTHDAPTVHDRLRRHRTALNELLAARGPDPRAIDDLRRATLWDEAPEALVPLVRTCPFAGFLDEGETRVGCLLHPALRGHDLRHGGVHCASVCREHLCAAHSWLRPAELELVELGRPDWYSYGILLAEPMLLRTLMTVVARRTGSEPRARRIARDPAARSALVSYLTLPRTFAWRERGGQRCGSSFLTACGELQPAASRAAPNHAAGLPWHDVLAALETPLSDPHAVEAAAAHLEQLVAPLCHAT